MCWGCGGKYGDGPLGSAIWGHACPVRPGGNEDVKEMSDISDTKFRFNWFSERFRVIEDALKETENFLATDAPKLDKRIGGEFVSAAAQALLEARRVLADSYIFTYYRKPKAQHQRKQRRPQVQLMDKDLFEFAQQELFSQVSLLSKLVEDRTGEPQFDPTLHAQTWKEMIKEYRDLKALEIKPQQMRIISLIRVVKDCVNAVLIAGVDAD